MERQLDLNFKQEETEGTEKKKSLFSLFAPVPILLFPPVQTGNWTGT
jgi:hypothetical protein